LFLDEITNTPIPRLPQYIAESRGLGCTICFAAQAGSQLDAVYGPLQGKAIRDVTPASLVMYGSHERDVMESAAFWAGKAARSHQSYAANHDEKATSRQFGNALEAAELLPAPLQKPGSSRAERRIRWSSSSISTNSCTISASCAGRGSSSSRSSGCSF
jgi:type IV secretory pathway TraG/TraD family ATPase VirD4